MLKLKKASKMTGINKISSEFSEKLQFELVNISIAIESSEDRLNISSTSEYIDKGISQAPYEYENLI